MMAAVMSSMIGFATAALHSASLVSLRPGGCTVSACRSSVLRLGLFPDDDLVLKSAKGAEQAGKGGLFPDEGPSTTEYVDREGIKSVYSMSTATEKDRGIEEYVDHKKTKQRMQRNVYKEIQEGVPVNRAAKRAMAKKNKKKKKAGK